ncbi:MFS transporter [Streptomyces sp. NPDC054863]
MGLLVDVTPLRRYPAFRRLVGGQCMTLLGSQVTQVVVPWQVYSLTQSSVSVGAVGLAALVPMVVCGLYGGAVADSMDRRRLILLVASCSALVSVVLVVQALAGLNNLWLLYGCVAVQAGLFAVDLPARRALVARLVGPDDLSAANSLLFLVFSVGFIGGPLIGGAMVVLGGYAVAYLVDIVAFAVAVTLLRGLPSLPLAGGGRRADVGSVVEGLRFLCKRPVLWMCYGLDIVATVLAMPAALFPALAVERFHGTTATAAYLSAALAAGHLLGTVLSGWLAAVRRVGVVSITVIVVWGVALAAFGLAREWWLALLFLAAAGAADTFSAVLRSSVLQRETPDAFLGRTAGVWTVVGAGGPRLGDGRAGFVAGFVGPGAAAVVGGVTCVVAVLALAAAVPSYLRYRIAPHQDK